MSTPLSNEFDLLQSPIEAGLTVIEASAGTGKTYSISHLVPRLLLTGELPDLSKLLLVTFTNDAARELSERVRRVLMLLESPPSSNEAQEQPGVASLRPLIEQEPGAKLRLSRALLDLDLLSVSTIHAFCQRTLQTEGALCGVPVMPEVITDERAQLETLVRDEWLARLSKDRALAAVAMAEGWTTAVVVELARNLRRRAGVSLEPCPCAFSDARVRIDNLIQGLSVKPAVDEAIGLIERVAAWNGGRERSDVLLELQPVFEGNADTIDFWRAVRNAAALPSWVTARKNEAKALKATLAACGWMTALNELVAAVRELSWVFACEVARAVPERAAALLEAERLITQDGLIDALHRALHRDGPDGAGQSARLAAQLAAKFHVALIDESQDTDPRQYGIFRRIFLNPRQPRRLILVGDPKQAIYGFRGADVRTYLRARTEAKRLYTLTRTFRAPQPLVSALNRLFERENAFHHPGMRFNAARSALAYDRQLYRAGVPCSRLEVWLADAEQLPEFTRARDRVSALSACVATTIVDLLEKGVLRTTYAGDRSPEELPVRTSHFAVLVATNAQADAMAEALQVRGVPAVVTSGGDVFGTEEARELRTLLAAILEPKRVGRVRAALATRMMGMTASGLHQLDHSRLAAEESLDELWSRLFQYWHERWHARGFAGLLAEFESDAALPASSPSGEALTAVAVSRRLATLPLTGERRVSNYRQLTDLLVEASRNEAPRPAELVRWLGQQISRAEDRSDVEERQLQLASDREAVQVVTMHKAKGLEYPLVFCPYLADSLRAPSGQILVNDDDAVSADVLVNLEQLPEPLQSRRARQHQIASLEERLRLAYVALTRAQVRAWTCSYSTAPRNDVSSPLDWLLRSDAELEVYSAFSDEWIEAARINRAARHQAALEELGAVEGVSRGRDALITFAPPPSASARHWIGPAAQASPEPLAAAKPPEIPSAWHVTSFSRLTRERHAHGAVSLGNDAGLNAGVPVGEPAADLSFFSAPGGAIVGTVVHEWIETWDFQSVDQEALRHHIRSTRLAALESGATWEAVLSQLFDRLRDVCLPGALSAPLHELCPEPHASEWHFNLPLAGTLTVVDFARCFEQHAAPEHRAYAPLLASLSEDGFQGLLQGFVDRLVRSGPFWGVIDWKTNRLGPSLASYEPEALLQCAMEDHYLLQTHLYLVALRRYLRAIGAADEKIAGAWLVFLRAIAPGEMRGVLHIDPPAAMLDALDTLFAQGAFTSR